MNTWNERLQFAMTARGKSAADLVRATGRKAPTIHEWLGKHASKKPTLKLGAENATKICGFLNINIDWLLTGKGSSGLAIGHHDDLPLPSYSLSQEYIPSLVDESGFTISIAVLANSGSMGYGDTQMGSDVFVGNMTVGKDWAQKNLGPLVTNLNHLAFIHGYGDSMSPTYQDGDILLVDTSVQEPNIDGVYVLRTDDKIFIKRVTRSFDGRHEISSDNPAVKKIDVFNGSHQVQVLGRVVWAWNGKRL